MLSRETELIKKQIIASYWEIILITFIFAVVNILSTYFIFSIFKVIPEKIDKKFEDYTKIFEISLAAFSPYLTFVVQGFFFPKIRKINVLRYLLFKPKAEEEDIKSIYDK